MRKLPLLFFLILTSIECFAAGPWGGTVNQLVVDEKSKAPLYAATSRGLFKYVDSSWVRLGGLGLNPVNTAVVTVNERLLAGVKGYGLKKSDDGGNTWTLVARGLKSRFGRPVDDVSVLEADPATPLTVYMGTNGKGFFESKDGGDSWQLKAEGLLSSAPPVNYVTTILPPHAKRPLIMGTDGEGLFAWVKESWEPLGRGYPRGLKVRETAADPDDPEHLLMATGFEGLWESFDAGVTWTQIKKGKFGVVSAVDVGKNGQSAAYFGQDGLYVVKGEHEAYLPMGFAAVRDIKARGDGGFYLATRDDGVLLCDSKAKLKGAVNTGMDAVTIHSFAQDPEGQGLWAGDGNGVFYSSDMGKTWEERSAGLITGAVNALSFVKGRLYAGTGGQGMFVWDQAKSEWIFRGKGLGTANTVNSLAVTSKSRIYAGTEGGVLYTDDGGVSWERVGPGIKLSSLTAVAAHPSDPARLWAANSNGLYETRDGGATWTQTAEGVFTGVKYAGDALWVKAQDRVLKLTGDALSQVFSSPGETVEDFLPAGEGLWVGTQKGLWYQDAQGPRYMWEGAGVTALFLDSRGRLQAGSDGLGVKSFKID